MLPGTQATVALAEVSAALYLPDGRLLLISNSSGAWVAPSLSRVAEAQRLPLPAIPADPEGACLTPEGRIWILGSHSGRKPERERISCYDARTLALIGSGTLSPAVRRAPAWRELASALSSGTLNFEGLAWTPRGLIVGCRAPNVGGKVALLTLRAPERFFDKYIPDFMDGVSLTWVPYGSGLGVRDLAWDGEKLLTISGGSVDGKPPFVLRALDSALHFIPGRDRALPKGQHWEAILVSPGKPPCVLADADSGCPFYQVAG